jgi:hypothetical protein
MKKLTYTMIAILILCIAGMIAIAGQVYDRSVKVVTATATSVTWTNLSPYAAIEIKRIWIDKAVKAIDTVTVTRVNSGDNVYTQAVGTITTAAGQGSTASLTTSYMKTGDKLVITPGFTNGSECVIEYIFQNHD